MMVSQQQQQQHHLQHKGDFSASPTTTAIVITDLPVGSALSLDGISIRLKRNDFVGIHSIPVDSTAEFHLVTVRAGSNKSGEDSGNNVGAVTVGFSFTTSSEDDEQNSILSLARRFDPTTEEVSSTPLDDTTISNICTQLQNHQIEPQRMISYSNLASGNQTTNDTWNRLTHFVSTRLLQKRGIQNGAKIVPGSYEDEIDSSAQQNSESIVDGISVTYPAIPVLQKDRKSAHHSRHPGTKQYLATLAPSERTALFLQHTHPNDCVVQDILHKYYDEQWKDIVGDVQLAYTLFLHLQCLSSLEHWRDLVAMLCNASTACMESHIDLFSNLIEILARQVTTIDEDFFEDIEMSGDNFLLPALRKLCQTALNVKDGIVQASRSNLYQIMTNRFKDSFGVSSNLDSADEFALQSMAMDTDQKRQSMDVDDEDNHNDDDDDADEAPVIVTNEEIEASKARSSQPGLTSTNNHHVSEEYPVGLRKKYPILFAAKMDHEDILMTCARALDEKTDVSLVREAGDYLIEEVEPQTDDL